MKFKLETGFGVGAFCAGLALLAGVAMQGAQARDQLKNVQLDTHSTFDTIVDADGKISLPGDDFLRDWTLLGTWVVNGGRDDGADGFHITYTQDWVVDSFRDHGEWPDGAVLVKELRHARTDDYTTGTISSATEVYGWFVMIKDTQNRFPESRLWGEGWGWAYFGADAADTLVTTDYEAECLGCHIPAQETDWIYNHGYPVLHTKGH